MPPWKVTSAGGRFIDGPFTKAEAETRRKVLGIAGARVVPGGAPTTRVLAVATNDDFSNVNSFVAYLEDDKRRTYTIQEITRLAHGVTSQLPALKLELQRRGYALAAVIQAPATHKRSSMAERLTVKGGVGKSPPKAPRPAGSFKPLPETEEMRAARRARSIPDVDLAPLADRAPRESLGKLDPAQIRNRSLAVAGLRARYQKIQIAADLYNDDIDKVNELILSLETVRLDAILEAVTGYNDGVEEVGAYLERLIESGETYASNLAEREPRGDDPDVHERWAVEVEAHGAWLDQIREALDQLESLDDDAVDIPDAPDAIDDDHKIDLGELQGEPNADGIAGIPEEPAVRRAATKRAVKK